MGALRTNEFFLDADLGSDGFELFGLSGDGTRDGEHAVDVLAVESVVEVAHGDVGEVDFQRVPIGLKELLGHRALYIDINDCHKSSRL